MQSISVIPSVRGPAPLTSFVEQDPAFAQPTPALLAFTEFYCQSGGSNVNGGSDRGNSAKFTSTNGNWSTVTNQFIPTDGSTALGTIAVGDYASVYIDAATLAVYIARVTAIDPGANGAITLSSTARAGTAPVTSATTRTIKVGGAWQGPNAAIGFPFQFAGTALHTATNLNGNQVRVNFLTGTYSITAGITASATEVVFQGYTSTPGDGGRATIDAGTTNAVIMTSNTGNKFADLVFANNATGANIAGLILTTGTSAYRCVVHDVRGDGINMGAGAPCSAIECEIYNFNKSNTASVAGIAIPGGGTNVVLRNYIHDGTTGTNCNGIRAAVGTGSFCISGNIIASCLGSAVSIANTPGGTLVGLISNNDFYNNGYGIRVEESAGSYFLQIENNNFIKNTNYAFDGGGSFTRLYGVMFNNGYGTGSQSNGSSGDYNRTGNLIRDADNQTKISYPSGQTPYSAPTTGNFSIVLAQAIGIGRGVFIETDGINTGTVGYPDIGAAQSQSVTQAFNVPNVIQILSDGFLGHAYNWKYILSQPATFTLQSGTLPTGLTLTQVDPASVQLTGTPTVVGPYVFTLRATIGTSYGDSTYQLTVNADPDEGIGGLLGGLRPTC